MGHVLRLALTVSTLVTGLAATPSVADVPTDHEGIALPSSATQEAVGRTATALAAEVTAPGPRSTAVPAAVAGARFVVGDWDGDGRDSLGVVAASGEVVLARSIADPSVVHRTRVPAGATVLVGDWDGDGRDTLGIRRGARIDLSDALGAPTTRTYWYGAAGDVPVVGDFDGDGRDTVSVRRGNQLLVTDTLRGGGASARAHFGLRSEPLHAPDLNGDGRDDMAIVRGPLVHARTSVSSGPATTVLVLPEGSTADVFGDFDGDGRDTPASTGR